MTQAKRTAPIKNKSSNSAPVRQASEAATVRVHDLSGIVCVGLSAELHTIFDDEAYREIVSAMESKVMTVIIRGLGDIAYLHLQLVTLDLGRVVGSPSKPRKSSARQPRSKA